MDPGNPYEPPQADLLRADEDRGPVDVPLVPWEDRVRFPGFAARGAAWLTRTVPRALAARVATGFAKPRRHQ